MPGAPLATLRVELLAAMFMNTFKMFCRSVGHPIPGGGPPANENWEFIRPSLPGPAAATALVGIGGVFILAALTAVFTAAGTGDPFASALAPARPAGASAAALRVCHRTLPKSRFCAEPAAAASARQPGRAAGSSAASSGDSSDEVAGRSKGPATSCSTSHGFNPVPPRTDSIQRRHLPLHQGCCVHQLHQSR